MKKIERVLDGRILKNRKRTTNALGAVEPQPKKNETTDYADFTDFFRQD